MKKQIITIILTLSAVFALTDCGKNDVQKSNVVGDGTDVQPTISASADSTVPATADPIENSPAKAATLAPAATEAPEAAEKAQAKLDANNGSSNAIVNDGSGERQVNIHFTLENHTGIDFPALLLAPATEDISKSGNILPDGQTFNNDTSIELNPGDGASLLTTIFNIAAVDSSGRGYVFQNIDLASSSQIGLYIEDNIPKAIIK